MTPTRESHGGLTFKIVLNIISGLR